MIFTLLLPILAWSGGACTAVDLRPQLGAPRDQSISSWCFAHSSADLVSLKLGRRVSAIDLALTDLLGDEAALLSTSDAELRKRIQNDSGFLARLHRWRLEAPESYLPERMFTENGLMNIGGMDQDAIYLSHQSGYCAEERLPEEGGYEQYLGEAKEFALARCGSGGLRECSFGSPARVGDITSPVSRALAQLFLDWKNERCGERIVPEKPLLPWSRDYAGDLVEYLEKLKRGELHRETVQADLFSVIDSRLSAGAAVSIGYDLSDLTGVEDPSDPLGDHSSVISARKEENGECFYFIRTHAGKSCGYLPALDSRCEAQEGGLWVRMQDLPSIYSVVGID